MIQPKSLLAEVVRVQDPEPSRYHKIRMDRNERTHPFSPQFMDRVRARLDDELLTTYPELEPLYEKFSRFLNQPQERLLFHLGSDLCIKSIFETYIEPGDKILLHRPGYAMFTVYARIFGCKPVFQECDEKLHFDYEQYISRIDESFKLAVLENPNGFTGNAPSRNMLYKFINQCEKKGVLAVVDEAYFYFHTVSAADVLDDYENLVIVRSFSKAFGIAGLRAGYLLSQDENIHNLKKVKPMHELNSFTIMVISEMLDSPDEIFSFVKKTSEELVYLKTGFAKLGIETSDSVTNFLAARMGRYITVTDVKEKLRQEGILIRRPFSEPRLHEWVRIGTAPFQYEQRLLDAVQEMIRK
jgi:histidinol-phosphate aminotransferase